MNAADFEPELKHASKNGSKAKREKMRKTHLNPRIRIEIYKAIQRYRKGDKIAYLEIMNEYNLTVIDLLRIL